MIARARAHGAEDWAEALASGWSKVAPLPESERTSA
jgi:hypothetical protein